jgi:DNA-binding NtrC family response regulator
MTIAARGAMGRTRTANVLIADVPELEDVFRSCFGLAHDVTYVPSYADAMDAISASRFDLIVVGMHFDESRMFDVIRFARLQGRNRDTPIVAVRGTPSDFSDGTREAIEHAVEALGGNAFIEFDLEPESLEEACRAVEKYLPGSAPSAAETRGQDDRV